jgi:hypothetical protein
MLRLLTSAVMAATLLCGSACLLPDSAPQATAARVKVKVKKKKVKVKKAAVVVNKTNVVVK